MYLQAKWLYFFPISMVSDGDVSFTLHFPVLNICDVLSIFHLLLKVTISSFIILVSLYNVIYIDMGS